MTSEEEERPSFITGGYGRHRRQWVNDSLKPKNKYRINKYKLNLNQKYKMQLKRRKENEITYMFCTALYAEQRLNTN